MAYLRVSTEGQSRSGLGLDVQRQAVATHLAQHGGELLAKFQEIESGRTAARSQLTAALACCRTRQDAAERGLRSIALGRRAWMFCGSDRGGEQAAAMYSLTHAAGPRKGSA